MGSAEQGGNHPQRVLFVGGPKHGDWMNLPSGDTEYRFVGMKTLSPDRSWNDWPDSAEHVYTLDEKLTNAWDGAGARFSVFSHEVLTTSPEHAGFNLYALRNAEKALSESQESLKFETKKLKEKDQVLIAARNDLEASRDAHAAAEEALRWVRQQLEPAASLIAGAIRLTGLDYEPIHKQPDV